MPLTREQFKTTLQILTPHFGGTEADRQGIVRAALHPSPVLDSVTWSGGADIFTPNLITRLGVHDDTISLIALLQHVRSPVGDSHQTAITTLIDELSAAAAGTPAFVFVSTPENQGRPVRRLIDDLTRLEVAHSIDPDGFAPGTPHWFRSVGDEIRKSQAVVWVVLPSTLNSERARTEIATAALLERKIFPVFMEGEQWIDVVWEEYIDAKHVDMRGDSYAAGLARLIAALRGTGDFKPVTPEPAPVPVSAEPENPYKGLFAFREADADRFFGREALIETLLTRLKAQLDGDKPRFLAVMGPSGAGKSSVVMAGLIPALKKDRIPGGRGWTILKSIAPGKHPIESLTDALAPVLSWALTAVQQDLSTPGGRMLSRLAGQLPGERAVLYVDQFEELFTQTADDGERQQIIDLLTGAATDPDGKLIVLLSMRADFLDRVLSFPQLGTLFNTYSELVQPMTIAELRDAIEKPALLPSAGLTFDLGLTAEIVFALRSRGTAMAGALPLLEFTLDRLFAEREVRRLTLAAYERMGGVEGAIGTHCEAVFSALLETAQSALGRVFLPLVHIDENTGEPTRKRASLADVTKDADAATLVEALVKNRLLQTGSDDGSPVVEITHEALFRHWQRLVDWIAVARKDIALLNELTRDAARWEASGRNRDHVWRGERAQAAQDMLARLQPDLTDVERAFARPEAEHLLDEIADINTSHIRRDEISRALHELNYELPGAGLTADGLPDIAWCYVDVPDDLRGKKVPFHDEDGRVYGKSEIKPFEIAMFPITYIQFQAFVDADDGFRNPEWWHRLRRKDNPDQARQP
ncbi:MAG: TIR domain-containing protein, partial [Chloroflexi bacterium]|nr:TIR domain-containing protein [Chloroflexota bacterium]